MEETMAQSVKQRKQHNPDSKVSILRKHFLEDVAVSDLCDGHDIHPTLFYRWQKEFFENGHLAFQRNGSTTERQLAKKVAKLEAKIRQKDEVLAEVMGEYIAVKKKIGEF